MVGSGSSLITGHVLCRASGLHPPHVVGQVDGNPLSLVRLGYSLHWELAIELAMWPRGPLRVLKMYTCASLYSSSIRATEPRSCVVSAAFKFQLRLSSIPELISPAGIKHFPEANALCAQHRVFPCSAKFMAGAWSAVLC